MVSPSTSLCSPTQKLSEPHHSGGFREVSLCRHNWLNHQQLVISSISSTSPLPFCGAESSNPLIMPWSFWQPAPSLKLSRGLQSPVISLTYKSPSYHSRDSNGFRCCMPATWDKNQIFIFIISFSPSRLIHYPSNPSKVGLSHSH